MFAKCDQSFWLQRASPATAAASDDEHRSGDRRTSFADCEQQLLAMPTQAIGGQQQQQHRQHRTDSAAEQPQMMNTGTATAGLCSQSRTMFCWQCQHRPSMASTSSSTIPSQRIQQRSGAAHFRRARTMHCWQSQDRPATAERESEEMSVLSLADLYRCHLHRQWSVSRRTNEVCATLSFLFFLRVIVNVRIPWHHQI